MFVMFSIALPKKTVYWYCAEISDCLDFSSCIKMLLLLITAATIESVNAGVEVDVLKMEAYRYYRCKGQGVSAIG